MSNELFDDIFTCVSQFGQIPVVIAGDLQAPPMTYPAIATAISFQSWHDPVAIVDDSGEVVRPLTFSNDGSFSGPGDGCTSIDSVLVNDIAFTALVHAEVVEAFSKQHRPIKLVFDWPSINQVGFHLLKSAPLVFEQSDGQPKNSEVSWDETHKLQYDCAQTAEQKWSIINNFLTCSLIAKVASWGEGPQTRGQPPIFVSKTIAPKQLSGHCAASRKGNFLAKLLGRLNELFIRLSRNEGSAQDTFIAQRTAHKALQQLSALSSPVVWNVDSIPSLLQVHLAKQWVVSTIKAHELQLKVSRIKCWKNRIKHSASHGAVPTFSITSKANNRKSLPT